MTTAIEKDQGMRETYVKRTLRSAEFAILAVIIVVSIVINLLNPAFASVANVLDIIRLITVNGMLALAVMLVLISGGIDVSFTAIANITSFSMMTFLVAMNFDGPVIVWFALAIVFGVVLGLVYGFFIAKMKLTALIVTLGTASLFYGASSFLMGTTPVFKFPQGIADFSGTYILTVPTASGVGTSSLHVSVLILAAMAIGLALFLNRTTLGRSIYAIGGNPVVAARAGINVSRVYYFVYALAGGISAVAGVTYASLSRIASPISLQGTELVVIAGTVLGGVLIMGGSGSVRGALLGVLLLTIVQNSLVLVGIPNTWQLVAVGAVLIFGTVLPAWRTSRRNRLIGRAQL